MSGSGSHKRPKFPRLRLAWRRAAAADRIGVLTVLVAVALVLGGVTLAVVLRVLALIGGVR